MRIRIAALAATILALLVTSAAVARDRFAYIFKRAPHETTIRVTSHWPDAEMLKRVDSFGDRYIYIRRGGVGYVITDAATLADADEAYREVDALRPSARAAEQRLRPYERELEAAERKLDAISDRLDDDENLSEAERAELEVKMRAAEEGMREIEERMRGMEEEAERLDKKMDALEDRAEERLEQVIERALANGVARKID
jgi:hypothetical protein